MSIPEADELDLGLEADAGLLENLGLHGGDQGVNI
jgi:hypothetical protein